MHVPTGNANRRVSITEVARAVKPRISGYLLALDISSRGLTLRIRKRGRGLRRMFLSLRPDYLDVFEITLEGSHPRSLKRRIFLKIHQDNRAASEEFSKLQLVWQHFRTSSEFRISTPLDLIGELNGVVTAGVEGFNLGDLIRWSRIRRRTRERVRSLISHVEQAGYWLRFLHRIEIHESCVSAIQQDLADDLERLMREAARFRFPEHLAAGVASKFDRIKELQRSSKSVLLHYDLTPEHVFLGESTVSVVDLEQLRMGPEAWDLARFCSYFDMMLAPLNVGLIFPLLKDRFLQAASLAGDSKLDELINGYSTVIMLQKWVDAMYRLSEGPSTLYLVLPILAKRALANIELLD